MVDTNALLTVALSIMANFTNTVSVPPTPVPRTLGAITRCIIGSPSSPIHQFLTLQDGTQFSIQGGAVSAYTSPNSYFQHQDLPSMDMFKGPAKISADDAIGLASQALQHLAKSGNPLASGTPRIQRSSAPEIPFYRVTWQDTNRHLATIARVEIDGRTSQIVDLHLVHPAFFDFAFERQIKERVYTRGQPPAPKGQALGRRSLSYPATNNVSELIDKSTAFCSRFGLNPTGPADLTTIDWDKSFVYTNAELSAVAPVTRITFTNGTVFESVGGTIYSYFASDACFVGDYMKRPRAEWARFRAETPSEWEPIAEQLKTRIRQQLHLPASALDSVRPNVRNSPLGPGRQPLTRILIDWRRWHPVTAKTSVEVFPRVFAAELDLHTGNTKSLSFADLSLLAPSVASTTGQPAH